MSKEINEFLGIPDDGSWTTICSTAIPCNLCGKLGLIENMVASRRGAIHQSCRVWTVEIGSFVVQIASLKANNYYQSYEIAKYVKLQGINPIREITIRVESQDCASILQQFANGDPSKLKSYDFVFDINDKVIKCRGVLSRSSYQHTDKFGWEEYTVSSLSDYYVNGERQKLLGGR